MKDKKAKNKNGGNSLTRKYDKIEKIFEKLKRNYEKINLLVTEMKNQSNAIEKRQIVTDQIKNKTKTKCKINFWSDSHFSELSDAPSAENIKQHTDFLILGGDIFENLNTLLEYVEILEKNKIMGCFVIGNHEMPLAHISSGVIPFPSIEIQNEAISIVLQKCSKFKYFKFLNYKNVVTFCEFKICGGFYWNSTYQNDCNILVTHFDQREQIERTQTEWRDNSIIEVLNSNKMKNLMIYFFGHSHHGANHNQFFHKYKNKIIFCCNQIKHSQDKMWQTYITNVPIFEITSTENEAFQNQICTNVLPPQEKINRQGFSRCGNSDNKKFWLDLVNDKEKTISILWKKWNMLQGNNSNRLCKSKYFLVSPGFADNSVKEKMKVAIKKIDLYSFESQEDIQNFVGAFFYAGYLYSDAMSFLPSFRQVNVIDVIRFCLQAVQYNFTKELAMHANKKDIYLKYKGMKIKLPERLVSYLKLESKRSIEINSTTEIFKIDTKS